jgi:hypothetical protein
VISRVDPLLSIRCRGRDTMDGLRNPLSPVPSICLDVPAPLSFGSDALGPDGWFPVETFHSRSDVRPVGSFQLLFRSLEDLAKLSQVDVAVSDFGRYSPKTIQRNSPKAGWWSAAPALTSMRGPGTNAVAIGGKGGKWKCWPLMNGPRKWKNVRDHSAGGNTVASRQVTALSPVQSREPSVSL